MPARKPPRMVYVPILGISLPRENKAHMALLHTLRCVVTGARCDEVHHPRGLQWGTGMGLKAPDETSIPLTKRIQTSITASGSKAGGRNMGATRIFYRRLFAV